MKRIIPLLFILAMACTEEKDLVLPGEYPVVLTSGFSSLDSTGITLEANLRRKGSAEITSHGFTWESGNLSYEANLTNPYEGRFFYRVTSDLETERTYFFRAFVETAGRRYYGETVEFTGLGALPPTITGLGAYSGPPGSFLRIFVENLSPIDSRNKVIFNGEEAQIISRSEGVLDIAVPYYSPSGLANIQIISGEQLSMVSSDFFVTGPFIESVSPGEAFRGDFIEIRGRSFMEREGGTWIKLGNRDIPVEEYSDTLLVGYIQPGFPLGNHSIQVDNANFVSNTEHQVTIRDVWQRIARIEVPGIEASFRHEGKIFIANQNTIYGFDPSDGEEEVFMTVPDLKIRRATFVSYGDRVYRIGGYNGYWVKDFAVIDMTDRTYTKQPDVPFNTTRISSFVQGKYAYLITMYADVWRLDMEQGTFEQLQKGPVPLSDGCFAYESNGQLLVVTVDGVYEYNTAADSWSLQSFEGDTKGLNVRSIRNGFFYKDHIYVADFYRNLLHFNKKYARWMNGGQVPDSYDDFIFYEDNGKVYLQSYLNVYEFQR